MLRGGIRAENIWVHVSIEGSADSPGRAGVVVVAGGAVVVAVAAGKGTFANKRVNSVQVGENSRSILFTITRIGKPLLYQFWGYGRAEDVSIDRICLKQHI